MQNTWLVLVAATCAGCSPAAVEGTGGSRGCSENAPQTDAVCSAGDAVGEAHEPLPLGPMLVVTCLIAGALATEYGCEQNVLDQVCPPGTTVTKTINDTWDKGKQKTVEISCDTVRLLVCGTAGV